VGGQVVTTKKTGDLYFYGTSEFVWGDDSKWHELGDLTTLGQLAYADTASVSYTPAGSVTFTNDNVTATVAPAASGDATYTPAGSVTLTTSSVTKTVAPAASGDATYTPAGSVTFTNGNVTATVSTETVTEQNPATYTPAGSVTLGTEEARTPSVSASDGTPTDNTFQVSGSVAAPSVSVATAGSTGTFATGITTAAPGTDAPANSIKYFNYDSANEVLSLFQIGYSTDTAKTGDAAYAADAPAFTGNYVKLANGSIKVPTTASFSGTGAKLVTGNISVPQSAAFSGTGARLVTDDFDIPTSASFSGTGARLETGNISVPQSAAFSGATATITVSPDAKSAGS